eukprot:CAMPEP_0172318818 /NCGR_PEP_ID=MMETSP1058-20130122/35880_1 /TAXON_ID=83371 /ORGANISM="Detonula confervacea, Strain CCMP 353" /LENGTH=271 /DNA_ID=CAMNT_0013033723 /DNA_START=47 /DNA_END=859 /DNA_ORIENTATION=+
MAYRTAIVALLLLTASSATTAFMTETLRVSAAPAHRSHSGATSIEYAAASSPSDGDKTIEIPSFVVSPVLTQVYPALIAHKAEYGNPNIPLGSTDGKRCKTLRRLHFQHKLTEEEASLLTEMGFAFHAFEDAYYECDFEEMMGKLLDYHEEFQTYQIPKKYKPDPELGAWVTMLRRLYRTDDVPKIQIDKLDAVGFEWLSTRKCGGSFMSKYREVLSYLSNIVEAGGDVSELLRDDHDVMKWVDAQRLAYENGNLSDSRVEYLDELPGIDW